MYVYVSMYVCISSAFNCCFSLSGSVAIASYSVCVYILSLVCSIVVLIYLQVWL